MKLYKYYSIEECHDQDELFNILNELQDDEKIDYELIRSSISGDVIKITDLDLTAQETKKLISDLNKLDIVEFPDYDYDPYLEEELFDDEDLDVYFDDNEF